MRLFKKKSKPPTTVEAFAHPRPGMRFHEMYSYWMYVLLVTDQGRVIVRTFSGHPANPVRETNKIKTFLSIEAFQDEWRYKYAPQAGYSVMYCDDKAFAAMKKELMVSAEDLERGYVI